MAERVQFPSVGGEMLTGLVDVPRGEVRGWGVFAHGFTLGKDFVASSRICKQLAAEGIGMLRYDNLGLGDSEGDWGDGSFSRKVADTVEAVRFMNASGRPSSCSSATRSAAPRSSTSRAGSRASAPSRPSARPPTQATPSSSTTPSSTGCWRRARPSGSSGGAR